MRALMAALEALRYPKPGVFSAVFEVVPFRHCANPRVFRTPLVLCPAPSRQKSGAVILGEARIRALQINCRDPSRPEGHSGGQPLPSVVKIKMTKHREHRGSQELIGDEEEWKGTGFMSDLMGSA